MVQEKVAFI